MKKKHTFSAVGSIIEINITPVRGRQYLSLAHWLQIYLAHLLRIFAIAAVHSLYVTGCSSDSKNI